MQGHVDSKKGRYQNAKFRSNVTLGLLVGAMFFSGFFWLAGVIGGTEYAAIASSGRLG